MTADAMLEVDGLVTGYGRSEILHHVSLAVGRGEAVGLVGPNGAGKSTLLKALAGVLKQWRGTTRFRGTSIGRHSAPRRVRSGLVLVPEGRHVFAQLSV